MNLSRIDTMLQEFATKGYQVLDPSEYKKLDSPMRLICSNGHNLTASLAEIRKASFQCEECNKERYGGEIQFLGSGEPRLVAIDGATENIGLSLYEGKNLICYRAVKIPSKYHLAKRLHIFREMIINLIIKEWKAEYIVVEDIQLQTGNPYAKASYYTAFKALAMLQGVVVETCVAYDIQYQLVSVNVWRSAFGLSGYKRREAKQKALDKVGILFNIKTKNDDVAEAILIGAWGADALKEALFTKNEVAERIPPKKLF